MAKPKKDKKAEAARLEAKRKRIADEKALQKEQEPEPEKERTLEDRVELLEFIVSKMAHYSGQGKIVREAGLPLWKPGKRDMTRWKDEVKEDAR